MKHKRTAIQRIEAYANTRRTNVTALELARGSHTNQHSVRRILGSVPVVGKGRCRVAEKVVKLYDIIT